MDLDDAELAARRALEPDLARDPEDEALDRAAVEWALGRLQRRPTFGARLRGLFRPPAGWAALAGVAVVASALVLVHRRPPVAPLAQAAPAPHPMVLNDGSEIEADAAQPAIQIAEQTPTRTTVRLSQGAARFRVRHDPRRTFRVDAGLVRIEDLGTVFQVAHQPDGRVRVSVSQGRVAVVWPGGGSRVELGAGDDRTFGPADAPAVAAVPPVSRASAEGRAPGATGPAHLLLAADSARRSGHPAAAVAPLKRLVALYPADPRAPSAAFTLGWVLLAELGRPREAALAFSEAERLAPRGTLAQDAAARVVEAWRKAGDERRAQAAARHYERAYPDGRDVRRFAGPH